jgi:hypothetical protein
MVNTDMVLAKGLVSAKVPSYGSNQARFQSSAFQWFWPYLLIHCHTSLLLSLALDSVGHWKSLIFEHRSIALFLPSQLVPNIIILEGKKGQNGTTRFPGLKGWAPLARRQVRLFVRLLVARLMAATSVLARQTNIYNYPMTQQVLSLVALQP